MKLQHNVQLKDYTSLHVGGPAETFIKLEPGDDLKSALKQTGQVWVLGYGTNILVSDEGLSGTVIINRVGHIDVNVDDGTISADSGANWDDLVQAAIANSLWGLEFASGIPGGVGAAVTGSIAAYGHRVSDRLIKADVLNTKNGSIETWQNDRFNFGYRRSDLQLPENSHYIVLNATFQLASEATGNLEYESALKTAADLGVKPDSLQNRQQIIMETRRRAGSLLDSTGAGTAGSFFKNPLVDADQLETIIAYEESPEKTREQILQQNRIHGQDKLRISAALVLLAGGFKRGQTWGEVRLHPDHILKIENAGNASAKDIYDVVHTIVSEVHQKLGVTLEPEVRFLGEF